MEEDTELKKLRDKCLFFNQFMIESGTIPKELIHVYQEVNKLIETSYQEGKIRPLKAASRDIDDQVIRHMPLSMAIELKRLFKEKLSNDFETVDKARLKAIEKILKKGKISREDEYELVLNRIDEIYADKNKIAEVKELNKLLNAFDTK